MRPWPVSVAQATRAYMGNESADFVWSSFVETWEIASKPAVECSNYATVMEDWLSFCSDAERKEVLMQEASVQDRRNLVTGHVPSDDDEAPVQEAKRPRLEAGAVRKADLQQVLRDRGIAFASKTTVAELRSLLDEAEGKAEAVVAVAVETKEAAEAEEVEECLSATCRRRCG